MAISRAGKAVFIAATGTSQFDFLEALTREEGIDWSKTTMFHLDEYIGLSPNHPASFRHYLHERLIDKVHPGQVYLIKGDAPDPQEECLRLGRLISSIEVDVAFVGIGENGHLAFNDPPADLSTEDPYLIVELDKRCRNQQVREGWFSSIEEVPKRAISMSIRQIMKAKNIICTVPEARKAEAVAQCLEGEISPEWPASILRRHQNVYYYLDEESASSLASERAAARSSQHTERKWGS
jgi:glucosamine-6-phosphate deaminase